jgi:macrophage erythroblast attacher
LDELYHIPTLADVKYENWSRTRLDRLLVDYLVRKGYTQSARALAADKGIGNLVDVDEFESLTRIERSLRKERRVDLALTWCGENKQTLKKMESTFEFELRMQQYVELIRTRQEDKLLEATLHARKHLAGASHNKSRLSIEWAGLLAFDQDTEVEPFSNYFSPDRWNKLANKFLETHHKIFSLPIQPMLHIALTAGLSALKTPACHSKFVSPTSGLNAASSPQPHSFNFSDDLDTDMTEEPRTSRLMPIDASMDFSFEPSQSTTLLNTPVCPICSTELNQLAKGVPFAHHSKSNVESDPVVLPNGRVYGRERLLALNEKMNTPEGYVIDPLDPEQVISWGQVRKIFIM